jgi:hypothetical protein
MPGMFYLAYIGSDGYPDLLITLALKSGKSLVLALLNRPCSLETSSQKQVDQKPRTFLLK